MLGKNQNLIINICQVQLKSAWGILFPEVAEIYTSLSQIRWESSSSQTPHGIQYQNNLKLSYPGLKSDQFENLDKFLKGLYEVVVTTEEGDRYQIAWEENPMEVDTKFNGGKTEITFSHTAIEPIRFIGNTIDEQEPLGFPYYLTFDLG